MFKSVFRHMAMTQVKDRHRSLIEIKHDLEQLVKYYPDYVAYTVYETGRPEVIVVASDKDKIVDFALGRYNMNFDKEYSGD